MSLLEALVLFLICFITGFVPVVVCGYFMYIRPLQQAHKQQRRRQSVTGIPLAKE